MCPACAGRALHLISAERISPAAMTAATMEHLKMNLIRSPPLQWILRPVFPLCAPLAILPASRVSLRVRFILFSFCPPFLCRSHSIECTYIIAERQKNASGIRARAYNVIYIKRRFFLCNFHKNRLRHRLLYCVAFTNMKDAQTFFS